jgi:hypothetical protein
MNWDNVRLAMGYRLKNIKDRPEKAFGSFMDYNWPVRLGRKGSLKTPSDKIRQN